MGEDGYDSVPGARLQPEFGEICCNRVDFDIVLLGKLAGFRQTDRGLIDSGDIEALLGEVYRIAAFSFGQAQNASHGQLPDLAAQEVIR